MGKIAFWSSSFTVLLIWYFSISPGLIQAEKFGNFGPLVTKESRKTITSSEDGEITAVDLHDGYSRGAFHLEFITLDTGSIFLPVFLHADMLFYVHSGRGMVKAISTETGGAKRIEVRKGDIYRLEEGSVFYVQSYPDPERKEKLRIHAIFYPIFHFENNPLCASVGAYSNISDLVRGFDDKILQMAFGVSEEDIRGIKSVEKPPPIVHFEPKNQTEEKDWKDEIFEALIGRRPLSIVNGKKKKGKKEKKEKTSTFNIFDDAEPDVENCNGRSISVTSDDYKLLLGSDIGFYMVNLTKGSMMGPHWNPKATEIAIVTHGQGIVQIVCPVDPSGEESKNFKCQTSKFRVSEGDIFIVPRYHPMSQISYNNGSFVFVGFTTMVGENHPQFLVGQRSVLKTMDRNVLALSFNVANTTVVDRLVDSQIESIMLECTSCAEELEMKIVEEEAKKREEEERKRREEEEKRREEERKRREEEEEEAKKREEEERKRREEEERKRREEEEAKKREEDERKRREEEEREREEEEARKREQEEAKKREEEERKEEEARRKEQEEEARRREQEEEEARRREEEEARRREQEKEEARRREEEEEKRREKEEEARRREEEEARQEEEARHREQEEEEARRREQEEEARRREEEEARQEEEARRREQEEEEGADRSRQPAPAPIA